MVIPEALKRNYNWLKQHSADSDGRGITIQLIASDRPGLIHDVSHSLNQLDCNILYTQSWTDHLQKAHILIQIEDLEEADRIKNTVAEITSIEDFQIIPSYSQSWGKRVIVVGGGAQVAQVASGAITEADRHNIRGERISIDTVPVVGEEEIASVVRATGRLHRVGILVLAGALMGGSICDAVKELREVHGVPVISLRMAGSINAYTDLTVTDPLEAGVMSVMAISHVAKFDILKLNGRDF